MVSLTEVAGKSTGKNRCICREINHCDIAFRSFMPWTNIVTQSGSYTADQTSPTLDTFATSPTPRSAEPTNDTSVMQRVSQSLDQIDALAAIVAEDIDYDIPELCFDVPTDFCLSIVIPVYNERETISRLLARVHTLPIPHELIIVDDCSTDGTVEILRAMEGIDGINVILKPQNEGKGAALRTGFEHVTGNVVVVQDADLEYDPRELLELIPPIIDNRADVVYGSRFLEDTSINSSWIHQAGNRALTIASNLTTGLKLTDMETCYKMIRSDLLDGMKLKQDRFGFEPEITAKLARRGARILELPISYKARSWEEGKKIGVRDGINALICIARYAFMD